MFYIIIWIESVCEIVFVEDVGVKFILIDYLVMIYNYVLLFDVL